MAERLLLCNKPVQCINNLRWNLNTVYFYFKLHYDKKEPFTKKNQRFMKMTLKNVFISD